MTEPLHSIIVVLGMHLQHAMEQRFRSPWPAEASKELEWAALVGKLGRVMNSPTRTTSLQAYTLLLYRKAVHPEFFAIDSRRRIENGAIEAEAWIFRGGQVVRFQRDKMCVCEIVTENPSALPERGLTKNMLCAGEHEHEETLSDNLTFMTAVQTETLADHLYLGTYREMMAHAKENGSLSVQWNDATTGKPNLSLVDLQRFRTEIHVQGWHLRSDCGLVLRTQSMFRLNDHSAKGVSRESW